MTKLIVILAHPTVHNNSAMFRKKA